MSVSINGTSGLVFTDGSTQNTSPFTGGLGFRNRIINGNFVVSQRGTGASATPSAGTTTYPSVDRWFIAQTGTTANLFLGQTAAQTTGVQTACFFGRTSGQTNVPAVIFMGQQIESKNMIDLRGQIITISFNAFRGATAPATLNVVCRFGTGSDEASGGGITGSWTGYSTGTASALTIGTTVASYTYSVTVPSNASEMNLLFYYTPSGTAGANEWYAFENVQLEKGSTATRFDYRPYGTELALCQRYFVKSFDGSGYSGGSPLVNAITGSSTRIAIPTVGVSMRTAPTITVYTTAGVAGSLTEFSSTTTRAVSGVFPYSTIGGGYCDIASITNPVIWVATCSAEL